MHDEGFEVPGTSTAVHETTGPRGALLVQFDGEFEDEVEAWVPQSQIHENSEVWKKKDKGKLVVTTWWAKKQGWCEE